MHIDVGCLSADIVPQEIARGFQELAHAAEIVEVCGSSKTSPRFSCFAVRRFDPLDRVE